jgi:uroporphyrinogen-III synthase
MKRVIVTGPVESASEYAAAARAAGWSAIEYPLVRVVAHRHDVSDIVKREFQWICITSSNALAYLADLQRCSPPLRNVPCAVVGERSAERTRALGLRTVLVASSSEDLAIEIAALTPAGALALWPRGHLSDELAERLRAGGIDVVDPVVYATLPLELDAEAPEASAVFFASPSAVRIWHEHERAPASRGERHAERRRIAIAIGRTTLDALMSEAEMSFSDAVALPEPTPAAFEIVLQHLDERDDESRG